MAFSISPVRSNVAIDYDPEKIAAMNLATYWGANALSGALSKGSNALAEYLKTHKDEEDSEDKSSKDDGYKTIKEEYGTQGYDVDLPEKSPWLKEEDSTKAMEGYDDSSNAESEKLSGYGNYMDAQLKEQQERDKSGKVDRNSENVSKLAEVIGAGVYNPDYINELYAALSDEEKTEFARHYPQFTSQFTEEGK